MEEEENTKDITLNPKQELFCRYYTEEGETFSNAYLSYARAYGYDFASLNNRRVKDDKDRDIIGTSEREKAESVCKSAGSRLLSNVKVRARIRDLMVVLFNQDDIADAKLTAIMLSGKDADAINAIKHRNDLKQRIIKKVELATINRPLAGLSDAELAQMAGVTSTEPKLAEQH